MDGDIDGVALLAEPLRRHLYRYIASQADGAGRDAAANATGISRGLAAFHLDRLVEAGLLSVSYRHLGTRRGPGAGRPAKIYARAEREVVVSLPERRYDVAGELLASALDDARGSTDVPSPTGGPVTVDALAVRAHKLGLSLGDEARRRAGSRPGRARLLAAASDVLAERGYEPALDDRSLVLRNCPFDALAQRHRALICGMNLSIMDGVLTGLRARGISATLDPQPGRCCVVWGRALTSIP